MPEFQSAGLRLAIYARVSTEEQREGQNIDSQIAELERFCREKAWLIAETYKDEGWSGGVMERPELDRLRDDARKGVFDAVLINDVDRLARDVAHLGVIKRDLERNGIKVMFRKLPADTSPTSNLMVNILGSFAEFERELIADRTRRGRRHKIEVRKQYLGSNTAFGYRYIPQDRVAGREGVLELNPSEAAVVRRMFEWVDNEGLSARRVMLRLNDEGIHPRKGTRRWAKSSVLRILHSEMYAGTWHYNKYQCCEPKSPEASRRYRRRAKCSIRLRPRHEWLPLELPEELRVVPRDRWVRVQQQLRQNYCLSPRNTRHNYLLRGLVWCGGCGRRYGGEPDHGRFSYRCIARCKRVPAIREAVLNRTVCDALAQVLLNPELILDPLRELDAAAEQQRSKMAHASSEADKQLKRLEGEEQRILDAYRAEIITPAQLADQLAHLKSRRAILEAKMREAETASAVTSPQVLKTAEEFCEEASRNLAEFTQEQWQQLLRTVIERIEFHGSRVTIKGRIPIPDPLPPATFRLKGIKLVASSPAKPQLPALSPTVDEISTKSPRPRL